MCPTDRRSMSTVGGKSTVQAHQSVLCQTPIETPWQKAETRSTVGGPHAGAKVRHAGIVDQACTAGEISGHIIWCWLRESDQSSAKFDLKTMRRHIEQFKHFSL